MQKGKIMDKRIKKQFWLSEQDADELKRKAALVGITETAVIRILLRGFEPREKPDSRFYEAIREMYAIGNNLNQLAVKANRMGFVDASMLKEEIDRLAKFQLNIERTFCAPFRVS